MERAQVFLSLTHSWSRVFLLRIIEYIYACFNINSLTIKHFCLPLLWIANFHSMPSSTTYSHIRIKYTVTFGGDHEKGKKKKKTSEEGVSSCPQTDLHSLFSQSTSQCLYLIVSSVCISPAQSWTPSSIKYDFLS